MIRGVINYYQAATHVYLDLRKYAWGIFPVASRVIRKLGGHLIPANQTSNLENIHKQYTKK
jgi:hypothetical protein